MAVNWSKDVDEELTAAKEQGRRFCWTSVPRQLEEPVLGSTPSLTKNPIPPISSTRIFCPSKPTSRNIPRASIVSKQSGRRPRFCQRATAKNASTRRAIFAPRHGRDLRYTIWRKRAGSAANCVEYAAAWRNRNSSWSCGLSPKMA